jgi:hypothetical protein
MSRIKNQDFMMRAKFMVTKVETIATNCERIQFQAVTEKPFDADGASDDNSFARWTPCGDLTITIQNPNLIGKFAPGKKFYSDFTPADS